MVLQSGDPLGPFWPNSNGAKKRTRGQPVGPPQVVFCQIPRRPKNGHKPQGTTFWPKDPRESIWPYWPYSLKTSTMASGSHHGPQSPSQRGFHSRSRKALTQVCGNQGWCIYGIKYHYAPFFLSSPMVKVSGPNYIILIQVPKSITHFKGRLFSHLVLQSLKATRRPLEDPNHLAMQELGHHFILGLFKG
ncbi:hypothetical protein O181_098251 [Austropuccinia psidii MF-1]|uniref:Uncharacterized protein n=1 Tax=Austropuccinia psidii MF-1 TaxID=1389203 RepID=A0A9Q3JAI7_9BASI|nr:hypothetical protein [Austropuccinia psidii MF-1]